MTTKEKDINGFKKEILKKQKEIKSIIKDYKERDLWEEIEDKENTYITDSFIKEMRSKYLENLAINIDKVLEAEKDILLMNIAIKIIDDSE